MVAWGTSFRWLLSSSFASLWKLEQWWMHFCTDCFSLTIIGFFQAGWEKEQKKMRPATAITENKGTTFRRTSKLKIHERKPHHPATITIEMKVWRSISETIPYFSILLIALKNLLENWLFPLFLLHLSLSIQTLTFKTISDSIKQKSFISSYWWMKSDVL